MQISGFIPQEWRGHLDLFAVNVQTLRLRIVILGFSVDSILGGIHDLIFNLRGQFFEYLRETLCRHALEHLEAVLVQKQNGNRNIFPYGSAWLLLTSSKACDWSGHFLGANAGTIVGLKQTNWLCFLLLLFLAVSMMPSV